MRDDRISIREVLSAQPRRTAYLSSALCVAVVSTYIPLLLIATFGVWRNTLFTASSLVPVLILIAISLFGIAIRNFWLPNLIAAIGITGAVFYGMTLGRAASEWIYWWPMWLLIIGGCALNAWGMTWCRNVIEHPS
jgi:hypothetical protein